MRRRLRHPQTGLLLGSLGKLTGPLLPAGTLESRFHLVCTTSSEVCQITLTDQSPVFQEKMGQGSELSGRADDP